MSTLTKAPESSRRKFNTVFSWLFVAVGIAFFAVPVYAAQTGDIEGVVTDVNGTPTAGVDVSLRGDVLPRGRSTQTNESGRYRFRLLPPGNYTLDFTMPDGSSVTRTTVVLLEQTADVNVAAGGQAIEEIVTTAAPMMADSGQGALKNAINSETIDALPVGQDYRDLMKLIPGVQYTEMGVRGPSAGGSGQDNVYQFDGVDVSLPLFGTLASEPSTHDVAQVSIVRGGAKAVGFNRSGGFLMNTVSHRGTDEFKAMAEYRVRPSGFVADQDNTSLSVFDEDRTWTNVRVGGPVVPEQLFFYLSYYRPDHTRDNRSNVYGEVGDYQSVRDEYYGKLTWAPTDSILLDVSYRTSDREGTRESIGGTEAASTSAGSTNTLDSLVAEGSIIFNDESSVSFKYVDWETKGITRPDTQFGFDAVIGDNLFANGALDQSGYAYVPRIISDESLAEIDPVENADQLAAALAYNDFVQPIIDQYGYMLDGELVGGGSVGGYYRTSSGSYFRESYEIAYDKTFEIGNTTHDLHFGYQWMDIAENVNRKSNGWGLIEVIGGYTGDPDDPVTDVYYEVETSQQSLVFPDGGAVAPEIYSSSEIQGFEINDTITWRDWTFNVGVLVSNDVLYGQGLARNPDNPVTGFELSPGTPYKMYEIDWSDMIQPRLGANWDYSDTGSVFLNFAMYNPSASSLARAASWDRNLQRDITVQFDQNGDFLDWSGEASSSGKQFQEGITPRTTTEWLLGTTQDLSSELTMRAHYRYKRSLHFWEDTWNWSRLYSSTTDRGGDAPDNVPHEPYISDEQWAAVRAEIGGSTYVIAELDHSFTKYHELSFEFDWNRENWFLTGSYTWSHYYGNIDQDSSTLGTNDFSAFIGSSWIADGRGRQLWDNKKGDLKGDRRHMFKFYGYYELPWNARAGGIALLQSGEPWETWSGEPYGYSNSYSNSRIRYAEPAGARRGPSHWQVDLNYTHFFNVGEDHKLELRADIFNLLDNQTGYNIQKSVASSQYGRPLSYYRPRLIQLSATYKFN